MKNGQWMCNFTGSECWDDGEYFDTKEQAIKYGKERINKLKDEEDEIYNTFGVGQVAMVPVSGVDVDSILEQVAENTTCETGEAGEYYLCDVDKEHCKELEEKINAVLLDWIKRHNYEPDFFRIENEETISL